MGIDTERQILLMGQQLERLRKVPTGVPSGAAFPSSVATGFVFFRTDVDFLCVYDGARWLTVHTEAIRFPRTTYSANTVDVNVMGVLPSDYAIELTRMDIYATLGVTNNGTNFWFYQLQRSSADITGALSTAAGGAGGDYQIGADLTTLLTVGGYLNIRVAKSGAPSNISVAGYVRYRLVIP